MPGVPENSQNPNPLIGSALPAVAEDILDVFPELAELFNFNIPVSRPRRPTPRQRRTQRPVVTPRNHIRLLNNQVQRVMHLFANSFDLNNNNPDEPSRNR